MATHICAPVHADRLPTCDDCSFGRARHHRLPAISQRRTPSHDQGEDRSGAKLFSDMLS